MNFLESKVERELRRRQYVIRLRDYQFPPRLKVALCGKPQMNFVRRLGLAPGLHTLVEGDANRVTAELMAQAATQDGPVMDAIMQAADYLAIGVANVMVTIHPDLVVLGGGVANMGDILFDRVRLQVRQRVRMLPAESVRIEPSDLGSDAGVAGAIALALQGVAANNE